MDQAGQTHCWGQNVFGQLGLGAGDPIAPVWAPGSPVSAPALQSIESGTAHTCGLDVGGGAHCWGDNSRGQLGNGTFTDSDVPVAVSGGLAFDAIVAEGLYTCALDAGGHAFCWGANDQAQLGDGTTNDQTSPVAVAGGHTFTSISTGSAHTCGLDAVGNALCWGWNPYGQVGNGAFGGADCNADCVLAPDAVSGGLTFSSISLGWEFSCGIETGGASHCWGRNNRGSLGDDSFTDQPAPTPVGGAETFVTLATGPFRHACGVTAGSQVFCWGSNGGGQVGDGTTTDAGSPVAVQGGRSFSSLWVGGIHTCGLEQGTGTLLCWGSNLDGQLGDGTSTNQPEPTPVTGGPTLTDASLGFTFTCARDAGGSVFCWGRNANGELGIGPTGSLVPLAVISF